MAFNWALYSVFSSAGSVILAHRIELLDAERSAATDRSLHDALTGLPNRRAFDSFLADAISRARRYRRALSLLLIDVDHFKAYNDTHGHPAGDEVLKRIAGEFIRLARETDLVSRVGGEEFALVLPETDGAGARAVAERIRAEITTLAQFHSPVTVSVGVATLAPGTPTAALLVKQCDAALYSAKRAGRNRVCEIESAVPDRRRAGRQQ
jgi:diguanylate cyclase (GGDEF)-like protein